jgi:hypothetical protein
VTVIADRRDNRAIEKVAKQLGCVTRHVAVSGAGLRKCAAVS